MKTWRFITIMFAALSMGMALCHLLEIPAKMTYDKALWLTLLQTLRSLRNDRCLHRSRCGGYGSGARDSHPAAPASIRLDTLRSALPSGRSSGLVGMGRSGERDDGTVDARNRAGRLDEAARPLGVHARRARGSSDDWCEEPGALDEVARLAREWFERHLTQEQERVST